MQVQNIHGVIPPLVTPLTSDRDVDVPSLERLVAFLIDAGVDAIWTLGACGEFYYLTDAQRAVVTETVVREVGRRVPVLVGCIDTGTTRSIEAARRAADLGADAVFTTAPCFAPVTQVEVLRHVTAVREVVDLPTFLYDAKYATQTPIEDVTLRKLVDDGALQGLKDSSGDLTTLRMHAVEFEGDSDTFTLLTGNEHMMDAALLMGAKGCVAPAANYAPELYVELYRCIRTDKWAAAARLQNRATRLSRDLDIWGGASPQAFLESAKTALRFRGIIQTNMSGEPTPEPTSPRERRVETVLASEGLATHELGV
jgi:4-hydroxy-tetrahydrodipicolinate synthase